MNKLLSIVIAGEVDHGKSSLVGRVLLDTHAIPSDRIDSVKNICSKKHVEFEPAFILDTFEEEQSQGITIDITQIQFSSSGSKYRFIDSPGHHEFLKNMITGSSSADAAILLIDANEGFKEQSRRHLYIFNMLGIDSVLVVVNKMDLVHYSEKVFKSLVHDCQTYLKKLHLHALHFIPISAKYGVNVSNKASELPWYSGTTFLKSLEHFSGKTKSKNRPFRYPIQDVYKFDHRRLMAGRIESGSIQTGSKVTVWPQKNTAEISTIERWSTPTTTIAFEGDSVAFTFKDQKFIERGNILTLPSEEMHVSNEIEAIVFWIGKKAIVTGSFLKLKLLTQEVKCQLSAIRYTIDPVTLEKSKTSRTQIEQNEVGHFLIKTTVPIAFDSFSDLKESGRFVLQDETSFCAWGIILKTWDSKPSSGIFSRINISSIIQRLSISYGGDSWLRSSMKAFSWRVFGFVCTYLLIAIFTKNKSLALKLGFVETALKLVGFFIHERIWNKIQFGQKEPQPYIIWFTGLPCSGKTTLAAHLNEHLVKMGYRSEHLDGDVLRNLLPITGYDEKSRNEYVCRIGVLASKLATNGVFVVASFISPYRESREFIKTLYPNFIEIYVSTSIEVCRQRDIKGLYTKALEGKIENFTGISGPYEVPQNPDLVVDTTHTPIKQNLDQILNYLQSRDSTLSLKRKRI